MIRDYAAADGDHEATNYLSGREGSISLSYGTLPLCFLLSQR
jgi:hypothetical protein